jgi:hypothetical protein
MKRKKTAENSVKTERPRKTEIINRMKEGEITFDDAQTLGFGSKKELWVACIRIAEPLVAEKIKSFKTTRIIDTGKQTDVLIDNKQTFLLKRIKIRDNRYDNLPEKTKTGMILTRRRLGGLVTPFIMYSGNIHGRPDLGEGMAALKITPLTSREIGRTRFIDEYMDLMEEHWRRDVFNPDFKAENLGRTGDGRLVVLDIGLPEDISDERIFRPNADLFWDIFHIGVDKLHQLRDDVKAANQNTAEYFEKRLKNRWSIKLREDWSRNSRGGDDIIPLAESLKKTVKKRCLPEGEKHAVYPFIIPEIEGEIRRMIKNRITQISHTT